MNFTIDDAYICDVTVRREWGMFDNIPVEELTGEQLLKILKGEDRCSSFGHKDHDEFTKLRDMLEELGYIKTQRNWWNGDVVLKPFTLNGWKFKKGHKFPCAAALKSSISCAKKFGWKSISSF